MFARLAWSNHNSLRVYNVLGLGRLVLQKVVWMWRAAGHFDFSALTTHVMIAKLYFCGELCDYLMGFWQAWAGGLVWDSRGTRADSRSTRRKIIVSNSLGKILYYSVHMVFSIFPGDFPQAGWFTTNVACPCGRMTYYDPGWLNPNTCSR